jgi:hypothetical protein
MVVYSGPLQGPPQTRPQWTKQESWDRDCSNEVAELQSGQRNMTAAGGRMTAAGGRMTPAGGRMMAAGGHMTGPGAA